MKIVTFYADCELTGKPQQKQAGFDWRNAIEQLRKSAARFGYETLVVSDTRTDIDAHWRYGNAKERGVMNWLLYAQWCTTIETDQGGDWAMVSPDTLIGKPIAFMFGPWDLSLLTRPRPKPIVNSVIAYKGSTRMAKLWGRVYDEFKHLPPDSKEWGADIDAVVNVLSIKPSETGLRECDDVRVKFYPMKGNFRSVALDISPRSIPEPIWDFKGARKALMPAYARLLQC